MLSCLSALLYFKLNIFSQCLLTLSGWQDDGQGLGIISSCLQSQKVEKIIRSSLHYLNGSPAVTGPCPEETQDQMLTEEPIPTSENQSQSQGCSVFNSQRPNMREEYLHEKLEVFTRRVDGLWTWMGYCCFTALASSLSLLSLSWDVKFSNKPGTTSDTYKNLFISNNNKKKMDTDQTIKYIKTINTVF